MQTFREGIAPLRQDVRTVNELSADLTPLDIQLSSTASRQLDQLNIRWKLLQVNPPDVKAGMFLHTLSSFSTLHTCLKCRIQYILFLPFPSFSPCRLVIYLHLFCLPPCLPQFLSLCAHADFTFCQPDTRDWELSLYLCTRFIWIHLVLNANTLSLHINGHYSHSTPVTFLLLCALGFLGLIRYGTRWAFLRVEHVSALGGQSWRSRQKGSELGSELLSVEFECVAQSIVMWKYKPAIWNILFFISAWLKKANCPVFFFSYFSLIEFTSFLFWKCSSPCKLLSVWWGQVYGIFSN